MKNSPEGSRNAGTSSEVAEVDLRVRVLDEINHPANEDDRRRQQHSGLQQPADHRFEPLVVHS